MKPKRDKKLAALAARAELEFEFVEQCFELGVLRVEELQEDAAAASRLAALRRLQRICRGLDVDVFAGSIIVDLLERLDETRRDLERLRGV